MAVLVLGLACLGCGASGPELASVKGHVTLNGQPLPDASIVFVPEKGRPAGARTNTKGGYVLTFTKGRKGALLGRHKVRISTSRGTSETRDGQPIPAVPETIPLNYNAQTELEFVVESGKKNIADFHITSASPLAARDQRIPK